MAIRASAPVKALRRLLEGLDRASVAGLDYGDEQLLLGAEEAEDVRLGDPRPLGHVLGRGPLVAARGQKQRPPPARTSSLRSSALMRWSALTEVMLVTDH